MSIPGQSGAGEFEIYTWRRIPVALSPWFFLLVLLVFWRDNNPITAALTVIIFAGSVLLHEYGHAFMAQRYGLRPKIVLHAFGGWCEHRAAPSRRRAFFVSAAGPAVTLLLAGGGWLLTEMIGARAGPMVYFILWRIAFLNAFLAVLNLLPVLPLDGGTMFHHALAWVAPQQRADGMAYWTGGILSVILCGYGLYERSLLIGLLFGFFAYQNITQAQPYDIMNSFVGKRKLPPADRIGLGYPVSPILWTLTAITMVSWLSGSALGTGTEIASLSLRPNVATTGHWWTLLTHVFVYRAWDWGPMLFTITALGGLGPRVEQKIGAIGLTAILVAAIALGAGAALLPAIAVLPSWIGAQPVYGAVAINAALLVAWTVVAPAKPAFFTPLTPRMLGPLVLVGGILASVFLTDWGWLPAVGGALAGLLAFIPFPGPLRDT